VFVPIVLELINFRILELMEGDKRVWLGEEEKLFKSDDW
jgi:hypothetical protein